jgi:hypothetical protein
LNDSDIGQREAARVERVLEDHRLHRVGDAQRIGSPIMLLALAACDVGL